MTTLPNGDMKLLCQKLDTITSQLADAKIETKAFREDVSRTIAQQSTQIALLEQANKQICKDVEARKLDCDELEGRLERQDTYNKIIGGLTAVLYAVAAFLGLSSNGGN